MELFLAKGSPAKGGQNMQTERKSEIVNFSKEGKRVHAQKKGS